MATRIHVTAIRSDAPDDVRAVFTEILGKGFDEVPVHQHNGWCWFHTSVWLVAAKDLNAGICRLAQPGLQFTTSDATCWYLVVHGGPGGPATLLHHFSYFSETPDAEEYDDAEWYDYEEDDETDPEYEAGMAFLMEESAEEKRPRKPFDDIAEDFSDYGVPLPKPLHDEWRELNTLDAINELREWHVTAVVEALTAASIPVDAAAMRDVLLWSNVTERESDGDIGNLPRLLSVLGLGPEWDNVVRQADEEEEDDYDEIDDEDEDDDYDEAPHAPDYIQEVMACVGEFALSPVATGPVSLPVGELRLAGFSAEACSTWNSPTVALMIALPSGHTAPDMPGRGSEALFIARTETGFNVGLKNRAWFGEDDITASLGPAYCELLQALPDGSHIDAAYAVPGEPATYHRFRGAVREGRWCIDEAYPPVSTDALTGSHDVARIEEDDHIVCRDEDEAKAVEAAARRDPFLHAMNVKRKGTRVSADFDAGNLPKLLLQARFPDAWDFAPAKAYAAKKYEETHAQSKDMRRASAEAARQRAAPHDAAVLWKGTHSWYWAADFLQLDQLDAEPRKRFETAMTALGFTHIGDLVAKKVRDVMVRVYASPDRHSYAVLMGKRTMYLGHEFASRLADGSGLTTTTNSTAESFPKAGIYYRAYPGMDPEALFEKHLDGLERFRIHKNTEPVTLEPTLIGVAQEIDHAFARAATLQNDEDDEE